MPSEIHLFTCNSLQSFRQIKQRTHEVLQIHFSMSCSIAFVTSHLSGIEAKNLQNGDVHIAQIPDFEMEYLENHLAH